MKRSIFMSLAVAVLACALALPLYAAGKAAPAGPIEVKAPAGMKMTKPVVKFNHKSHAAAKCADCHHKKVGNTEFVACNSKGCHEDTAAKTGVKSFYAAFHGNNGKSCVGCHKAAKESGKNAPTACDKCHVKA